MYEPMTTNDSSFWGSVPLDVDVGFWAGAAWPKAELEPMHAVAISASAAMSIRKRDGLIGRVRKWGERRTLNVERRTLNLGKFGPPDPHGVAGFRSGRSENSKFDVRCSMFDVPRRRRCRAKRQQSVG